MKKNVCVFEFVLLTYNPGERWQSQMYKGLQIWVSEKKNHFHWFQTKVEVGFFTFREWLRNKSCSFLAEVSREKCKSHYFSALIRGYFPSSLAIYLARSIMPNSVALDIIFIRWSVYIIRVCCRAIEKHMVLFRIYRSCSTEGSLFLAVYFQKPFSRQGRDCRGKEPLQCVFRKKAARS